ncbi:MAG: hypothetical protein JW837_14295 [Sedimentisphaerales bacterium]|nr:hypothetical protein [Sedimentisphaerales bacterium]
MLRKYLIVSIVVLLFTSGAFADIGHMQGFSIGAQNMVTRCGPVGSAQGENIVMVGQSQQVHKPCFSVTAGQSYGGTLVQRGAAFGAGGASGVTNNASIQGLQGQHANPFGSTNQAQNLNVNLGQVATKFGGVGGTQGAHSFIGGQSQTITTPLVTSAQSHNVGIQQSAVITGCNGSNAKVVNNVNVNMSQGQNAGGVPVFPHYKN